MLTSVRGLLTASMLAGCGLAASPAFAEEAATDITVSGFVTGVSDYRFHGLSNSAGDFAIQGSITATHSSGLYFGTWASSIEQDATDVHGSAEIDFYAGWSGKVADNLTADVGLTYYTFPSGSFGDGNVFEPYATLATAVGPVSAKVGAAYALKQDALGGKDSLYLFTDLGMDIADGPVSLNAHLAYTDGVNSPKTLTGAGTGGGFDYGVGAAYKITDKLSLGLNYIGVEGNSIDGYSNDAVVASIKLAL